MGKWQYCAGNCKICICDLYHFLSFHRFRENGIVRVRYVKNTVEILIQEEMENISEGLSFRVALEECFGKGYLIKDFNQPFES